MEDEKWVGKEEEWVEDEEEYYYKRRKMVIVSKMLISFRANCPAKENRGRV